MTGTASISLPDPRHRGDVSVEEALLARRSVREFASRPLTLAQVSQLLWSAQGITGGEGGRTAPSAGALFPLELHMLAGNVRGLPTGVYRYRPASHSLAMVSEADERARLARAALGQGCVKAGPVVIVIAAVSKRVTGKYGGRGARYVHMEAGHAAENIHLQAVALKLGTVVVGAFEDDLVAKILELPAGERPQLLMPVGHPA